MMRLAYAMPAAVAPPALAIGIDVISACQLTSLMRIACMQEAEDILAEMQVEPRDLLWESAAFRKPD
ncbi:hypothetical protein [Methylobacterium nodulans]|nr:hypothetical protein [Methylobacterium nodulans]